MKKILILILLLLSACTPKVKEEIKEEKENIETSEPVVEEEQIEEETIKYKFDGSNILVFFGVGMGYYVFESKGMYPPDVVYMFLNENKDYIGFIYQYGEWIPIEGLVEQYPMEDGNPYGYRGKLTKLADNVYASKGAEVLIPPTKINDENITISEEVDFYLILNEEEQTLYFCFEDLDIEELKNYKNESTKYVIAQKTMKKLNQNQ